MGAVVTYGNEAEALMAEDGKHSSRSVPLMIQSGARQPVAIATAVGLGWLWAAMKVSRERSAA
jgi:hypothetical protein